MAETKHQLEPTTFPAKCKPNLNFEDNPQKTLKFQPPLDNSTIVSQEKNPILEAPERYSSAPDDKDIKFEADSLVEAEDDGNDDFEDDDEDVENDRGEAEVDRKGKGIVRDDKGKGKLKVEEEDADADDEEDEDNDSDSGTDISNSESDLSDNPLAEVDLDNILPSRTRRRTVQHGVYVANDIGNNDDDSNDSDA
ncbi:prostatic spermine-binding protein-like [Juglans microcarpa x Juglans regia]|uniref:prostatic spermine-binding protein-like n=1 Tax=Juglans microcarpa x Juglans regia TaxID=2249226 RepID=UPI001B7DDD77|nr:prostatic spermine-binding protein-like [Juglans microcarpa x Juglans regia]